MISYNYFIRTIRYTLAIVALYGLLMVVDKEFCGGVLDAFLARIDPHIVIEYVNNDLKLEAAINYAQTDSTHVSMRLLWTI